MPEKKLWIAYNAEEAEGVTTDLNKAMDAVTEWFQQETDLTDEQVKERVRFNLKFGIWVLMLDGVPQWGYKIDDVPELP